MILDEAILVRDILDEMERKPSKKMLKRWKNQHELSLKQPQIAPIGQHEFIELQIAGMA